MSVRLVSIEMLVVAIKSVSSPIIYCLALKKKNPARLAPRKHKLDTEITRTFKGKLIFPSRVERHRSVRIVVRLGVRARPFERFFKLLE